MRMSETEEHGRKHERSSSDLAREAMFSRISDRMFGMRLPDVMIDRFVVRGALGEGGMGTVLLAWDPQLKRNVAIKIVPIEEGEDRAWQLREAQTLAQVKHSNVVVVHEIGQRSHDLFIVMEYVEGKTLENWLASESRSITDIVGVFIEAARGLAAVHRAGIVHRDFKPSNVLVGEDDRVKVADFGIARPHDVDEPLSVIDASLVTRGGATPTTRLQGTLPYVAPEQLAGAPPEPRGDQFSFCVSLWQALKGDPPFSAGALALAAEGDDLPEPAHAHKVPRRFDRIVRRGLARDPGQRWPDMDALGNALKAGLSRSTGQRVFALAGFIAVALVVILLKKDPCPDAQGELTSVWNPERASELDRKLSEAPEFTRVSWQSVAVRFNRYADEWASVRRGVCKATRVEHRRSESAFDDATICLERARASFANVIEILAIGNTTTFENLDPVLAKLQSPKACEHARTMGVQPPALKDKDHVAAYRERIDHAGLLTAAGQPTVALTSLTELLPEIDAIGYLPLASEARLQLGNAKKEIGDVAGAEESLFEAVLQAERSGDANVRLDAMIQLAVIAVDDHENLAEARRWLAQADAIAGSVEADPRVQAHLAIVTGMVASLANDLDTAESSYRTALLLAKDLGDGSNALLAAARTRLAIVFVQAGKHAEARVMDTEIEEDLTKRLGPRHPSVAALALNVGLGALERGELDEAGRQAERALSIQTEAFGAESPRIAAALRLNAAVAIERKQWARAIDLAGRAWQLERLHFDRGHSERAAALVRLAEARLAIGDLVGALADYEELEREFSEGANTWQVPGVSQTIAYLLCRLNRCEEARERFVRLRDQLPETAMLRVYATADLANAEFQLGNCKVAEPLVAEVLPVARAAEGEDELLATLLWTQAGCLANRRSERERALTAATEARSLFVVHGTRADAVSALDGLIGRLKRKTR